MGVTNTVPRNESKERRKDKKKGPLPKKIDPTASHRGGPCWTWEVLVKLEEEVVYNAETILSV